MREEKRQEKIARMGQKRIKKEERRAAKSMRSKDRAFAMKDGRTHFGYKIHNSVGTDGLQFSYVVHHRTS